MYDSSKFQAAFKQWLEENCEVGFGEHYAGDLLDDFEDFLAKTSLLKRSPGRVVFGKELNNQEGFERRKRLGLTYWSGLTLKNPPKRDALKPKRYTRTQEFEEDRYLEQARLKHRAELNKSPEAEEARLAAFKRELEEETRENIVEVGKNENL